ncbi:type II toxin-antitoxin system Phd/YefM family antitoxin [Salinarimonas chemoclinalis]|uniref:type II toxin-antitoxin system Phd/YefM family antitoxin n=1 Tax=Salinarimonas chemoclinalis TaxID=3241599 RepID=UPI0035562931
MTRVTFGDFRDDLDEFLEEVCTTHAPLTVTRPGGGSVVVLPAEDYAGLLETVHLLKHPENARRLADAIAELDAGRGLERDLIG